MGNIVSFGQNNEKLYKCVNNMMNGNYDDINTITDLLEKYIDRIIFAIIRNQQITDMLVGQVLTNIFNDISELDSVKHFWRWCFRKSVDVSVNYIYENGMDMKFDAYTTSGVPDGVSFDYWYKDTEMFIPGIVVMESANLLQLWALLGGLSMGQQAIMLYFYFADMSVDEIAVALGCTPKIVRRGIDYGRNIIKNKLEEYYGNAKTKKLSMGRLPIIQVMYQEVVYNVANTSVGKNDVIYNTDTGKKQSAEYQTMNQIPNRIANLPKIGGMGYFQNITQGFMQPMHDTYVSNRGMTDAPLINNQGTTEAPLTEMDSVFMDGIELISGGNIRRSEVINVSDSNTLESIIANGSGIRDEHLRESDPEHFYTVNYKWFDLAAKAGNTEAMNNLAYCFFFGYGTKKNFGLAISWYKKSANAGNAYAKEYLDRLREQGFLEDEES